MRRFVFALLLLLPFASGANGSGFQVTAQGARALGMGMAWTAVADDSSAIYYNPAGLAFADERDFIIGGMYVTNPEATFQRAGTSVVEDQREGHNLLPELYAAGELWGTKVGIGAYTPFGLPIRWENPTTFSGRFVSHTAIVRTANVNPTAAWKLGSNAAVGVGLDYMYSKVQLERFVPLSPTLTPVSSGKLKSDLMDSTGWGWNVGFLWRSGPLSFGAAYRSSIEVDHDAEIGFTPAVGPLPPPGTPASVTIEFPDSLNLGAAYRVGGVTFAADYDRTGWSSFDRLQVIVDGTPLIDRATDWEDSAAWRLGVEAPVGPVKLRAGYYRDETPQPQEDVGPVLPDADRQGYTIGIGFDVGRFTIDLANAYIRFDSRSSLFNAAEPLAPVGTYETTGNEFALNVHFH